MGETIIGEKKKAQYWTIHFSEIIFQIPTQIWFNLIQKIFTTHTTIGKRSSQENLNGLGCCCPNHNYRALLWVPGTYVPGKCLKAMTQLISGTEIKPAPRVLAVLSDDSHWTLSQRAQPPRSLLCSLYFCWGHWWKNSVNASRNC